MNQLLRRRLVLSSRTPMESVGPRHAVTSRHMAALARLSRVTAEASVITTVPQPGVLALAADSDGRPLAGRSLPSRS